MGAVIDGCPAGVVWKQDLLEGFLERRRPGKSELTSARNESDRPQILSGVYEGKTLGTPIAMIIPNLDQRSQDYDPAKLKMRQGHATDLWQRKFGHSDPRGSGRASGRETVSRVLGGSVARMMVQQLFPEVRVIAFTESIGGICLSEDEISSAVTRLHSDTWAIDQQSARCPSLEKNAQIDELLRNAKISGESFGGTVNVRVLGLPSGLGQPVFGKLKNSFADALFSIGATTALEIGEGFAGSVKNGKQFHNSTQDYGGIRGGLSTGDPVSMRISFKPTSSRAEVAKSGRHDPCIVPRAIPVVEAMIWLVMADHILLSRLDRI